MLLLSGKMEHLPTAIDFGIYRVQKLGDHLPNIHAPIRRDGYMIIFSGPHGAVHHLDNRVFSLPPYSVLFIGPDRVSRFDEDMTEDTYVLVFSSGFFGRSNRDLHFLQNSPLFNDYGQIYYMTLPGEGLLYGKVMVHLLYQARNGIEEQINRDLAHNLIEQILIMGSLNIQQVSNANYRDDLDNLLVLRYRTLIAEHVVSEKSVKFYADKLNVTERRLTKATEKVVGVGAKELIIEYVMEKARRRLINSEKSVKEISLSLGFSGEHNFSAFFFKYAGIRPSEFRKRTNL